MPLHPAAHSESTFIVYAVDLPSVAPLGEQARLLGGMLKAIERRRPQDSIDLVGHSAGGGVARLALVNYGAGNCRRLVTVASPHLGTERALSRWPASMT